MNLKEKELQTRILEFAEGSIDSVTSSLQIQAFEKGRLKVDLRMGKAYTYFDLASLTKILFTTLACMRLVQKDEAFLKKPFLKKDSGFLAVDLNMKALLTHTAGLPWWAPFYEELKGPKNHKKRWLELKELLKKIRPEERQKAIYSDLDFLFLGIAVEEFTGENLLEHWEKLSAELRLGRLHFNVNNKPSYKRSLYAPTERCPWRKKCLQGEAHDDNTWALGGVAPHAGLFGRIDDVSEFGLRLRNLHQGKRDSLTSSAVLQRFARRQVPRARGDWGLGFMLPTPGSASSGAHFSKTSFGHTGFTGTSLWYDPQKDWLVVILSNRVHPTRDNRRFVELRPKIHDWIVKA